MTPFKELCEFLTTNQRNTWFYYSHTLYNTLDDLEKSLVYMEEIKDSGLIRLWYPRTRFTEKPLYKEEYNRLLQKALEKEDWDEVKKLKQRLRKEE